MRLLHAGAGEYHIASDADVVGMQAVWLDEDDLYVSPMGFTGIHIRDLPLTENKCLR